MFRFEFESEKWEVYHQPEKGDRSVPVPRGSFGMDVDKGNIWLFGGTDGARQLNDLWCFNIATKVWTQVRSEPEDPAKVPEPRRNLTLVVFRDNLFIFGGILDVTK